MSVDIHHKERSLKLYLSKTDDPDIHEFLNVLQASNYSISRVEKYAVTLLVLEGFVGKRLRDATKDDLERFVLSLKSKKPWTKDTVLKQVKIFYRWLASGTLERNAPYPEIVSWIKAGVKKDELEEPEILTEDEVKALIDKASTTRDKALIAVLFDAGFRIGEILPGRVGDAEFDEMGAKIRVHGKTGSKVVRLIASAPLLARWIDEHPEKDNPNAWLWFSRKRLSRGMPTARPARYQQCADRFGC
ncbi:MAG: tyrosine-type recombinase/integrase [Conexivisphaerales archaeon]